MKTTKSYYNTTKQKADYVSAEEKKCKSQEQIVLKLFIMHRKLSASKVWKLYPNDVPLTSIRRAMSNLQKADCITITEEQVKGVYGKPEKVYKLLENYNQLLLF